MQEIEPQESPQEARASVDWYFIVFRWLILLLFAVCLISNIYSSVLYVDMIYYYSACDECTFVIYEGFALAATLAIILGLFIGLYLMLLQKLGALRIYLTVFFLAGWMQMLLILLLTQLFPISHAVHTKWMQQKSLEFYELKYDCCGVLGPDDYLLTSGSLPSSCFYNNSTLAKDLHYSGCMNKSFEHPTVIRIEFLSSLILFILIGCLAMYYLYLKKHGLGARSLHELWHARIIL